VEKVYINGLKIARGYDHDMGEVLNRLGALDIGQAMKDHLKDMDLVGAELVR
jgi:hypothetical protein